MSERTAEKITQAAIRHNGRIYAVAPPYRHHDVIRQMAADGLGPECMHDQGFLTDAGRFVDRTMAANIARAAGQIKVKTGPSDKLFSEDVW